LLVALLCGVDHAAHAQTASDDPSDGAGHALTLPATNTGTAIVVCTPGANNTGFTLAGSTSTPTSLIPAPPCGSFTAGTTRDVWVRIDLPATDDVRFRVTVSGAGSPALSNGAMAAYLAPSASGPFSLITCAVGGNPSPGQSNNPSLELTCLPPGGHVYLRIWDEVTNASNASFNVCVQRQNFTTNPINSVWDTPCNAAVLTNSLVNLHNTFACTEDFPWSPSCGSYQGGDVWAKYTVPASGAVKITAQQTVVNQRMAMAVYTATDCADLASFREVACGEMPLPVSPVVLEVRCLQPGSTIYVRVYATAAAQINPPRFQLFRLMAENLTAPTPTAVNDRPCTATPLTVSANCSPNYFGGDWSFGFNLGACATPGAPPPGCGISTSNTPDVWFSFVAPDNGTVAIRVDGDNSSNPAFDPAMALYTTGGASCAGPLTLVECDDRHGPGRNAYAVRSGLIPGQTYYLRVWGEGTSGTQTGIFYVCITSPEPPAGECLYLVELSSSTAEGTQVMRVAIGNDTTDLVTSGEASQLFLISLPQGASVTFLYYNNATTGTCTYAVAQLGGPWLWVGNTTGAVIGPTPPPSSQYHLSPTCTPLAASPEDCIGATTLCAPDLSVFSSTQASGLNVVDLTAANRGCLSDELNGGRWFFLRPVMDGEISFYVEVPGLIPPVDLDFAIWDTEPDDVLGEHQPDSILVHHRICVPDGPPIRCSSARLGGRTGLREDMHGRYSEGVEGFSWVAPLPVQAGHVYILYVASIFHSGSQQLHLRWTRLVDSNGVNAPGILGDCTPIVLPLELLHITAEAEAGRNMVRWTTASERHTQHFDVERSTTGLDFTRIGRVGAMGHSTTATDYLFPDQVPPPGLSHYRLRMVDIDGAFTYSPIVTVVRDGHAELTLYPNPATDHLRAILPRHAGNAPAHLQLLDGMGRSVWEQTMTKSADQPELLILVGGLPPGSYLVRIVLQREVLTGRFIIER
jgi:hypothetical protein